MTSKSSDPTARGRQRRSRAVGLSPAAPADAVAFGAADQISQADDSLGPAGPSGQATGGQSGPRRSVSRAPRGPVDPRLVKRARATRSYILAGAVVGCVTAGLVLLQAWLLSDSIAGLFYGAGAGSLGWAVLGLTAVLIGRGLMSWLNSWLSQRAAAQVKSQLRQDILAARLDNPALAASTSSTLVTLVTQGLDALDGYFSKYLPQLLLAATVPVIIGAAILWTDWRSAVIIAVTIPFIPLLMALVGWTTQAKVERRWAYQTRLANHFADLVAGLPTLQVFGRARAQAAGLRRTEAANRRETMSILRVSFLSALVLELFSSLAVAVIAVTIGTRLVYNFDFHLDVALFILILAPEVYLPIRQVGVHYHDSADGLAAAEAAFREIDRAWPVGPDQADRRAPQSVAIQAQGLGFSYPEADRPALADFDLDLAPGQIVALAGRSGGGKTTLLNLVLGFLPHQTGQLRLGGVEAARLDWAAWRRLTAYVPQTPGLVDGSLTDNVRLGWPAADLAQIKLALERAGAGSLSPARQIGQGGEGLSVGERRRVGLARALLRIDQGSARLLLLDEPTAGLDTDTETKVLASLRASGASALVVSHRPAVLEAADRVVWLAEPDEPAEPAESDGSAEPAERERSDRTAGEAALESSAEASTETADRRPSQLPAATADAGGTVSWLFPDVARSEAEPDDLIGEPAPTLPDAPGRSALRRLVTSLLDQVPQGRSRLAGAIALAAVAAGASVALMAVSAWLISRAAEHPNFMLLTVAAVGVRTFALSRAVFRYVERLVGHDLALRMQSALRLRTYISLARTTLLGRSRGDLLVRVVADVGAIEDVVARVVIPFVAATVVVGGTGVMLARFSVGATAVLILSALVGGFLVPWFTQRVSQRADRAAVPLRGRLGALVHNLALSAPDLAAYDASPAALAGLAKVDGQLRQVEARAAWAKGVGAGLQVLAAGLAVIGGLWIGGQAVAAGQLDGRLLAVLVLTPLALHEVFANFAQSAQTQTRAETALDRVVAVLEAEPVGRGDVEPSAPERAAQLSLSQVDVGWPGAEPVVRGVDLELGPGQSLAVIGPSGVGKTTLAATIMGLIPAQGGQLEAVGRIGYLAQDAHIFATSVAENVRIGHKGASPEQVVTALRRAGLSLDPDRSVGELGSTLSGGEARRLALSRLLVGDYGLLILDEPTEHLDRETADALMDDIWANLDSRPVLVISHDESLAARCDRVIDLGALSSSGVSQLEVGL